MLRSCPSLMALVPCYASSFLKLKKSSLFLLSSEYARDAVRTTSTTPTLTLPPISNPPALVPLTPFPRPSPHSISFFRALLPLHPPPLHHYLTPRFLPALPVPTFTSPQIKPRLLSRLFVYVKNGI